jgi:hypothetical protein
VKMRTGCNPKARLCDDDDESLGSTKTVIFRDCQLKEDSN